MSFPCIQQLRLYHHLCNTRKCMLFWSMVRLSPIPFTSNHGQIYFIPLFSPNQCITQNTRMASRKSLPLSRDQCDSVSNNNCSGRKINKHKLFSRDCFTSFTFSSSITSPDDDDLFDSSVLALAVEAAAKAKCSFHESLPPSLIAEQSNHDHGCVPRFKWEECELGSHLGFGEFSDAYEIKSFQFENHHFQSSSMTNMGMSVSEMDQRLQMKGREKHRLTKKPRYALKQIRPKHLETGQESHKCIQAAIDLATEKEFLSSLSHPHIIKLRGVTSSGPTGEALIIDCLVDTLDERIRRWRKSGNKLKGQSSLRRSMNPLSSSSSLRRSMNNLSSSFTSKDKSESRSGPSKVVDYRLKIALQIAAAMKYLHSHGIIYRDLKPANIGFDVRGDIKLFDFGLARFCPESEGDPNLDVFEMSGAGTPRYMAPECLSGDMYNMKADVYSFAIVCWEILSGETPYIFARRRDHLRIYVVEENGRPEINPSWPDDIQIMLKNCFDCEMAKRYKMELVYSCIREVLLSLRGGDCHELDEEWLSRPRSIVSNKG